MDSRFINAKSPANGDGDPPCERRCHYTLAVLQRVLSEQLDIECQSQAKLSIQPDSKMVVVSGPLLNVLEAIRLLESRVAMDDSTTKQRRVLESEDSSYDSDYENSESLSPREPMVHDDVSRTVSDTLGAEFEEYITQSPDTLLSSITEDPGYTSRVEFGLKLGYTEAQVQLALQKLGAQAGQNELLAELIKLGATGKGAKERADDIGTDVSRLQLDSLDDSYNLRHVVIDGSNVAMSHGNKECFSCRGIKLCVEWFRARGHKEITVFVPRWRKEASRPDAPIKDQEILLNLEKERMLVFTPSRHVGGRRMVCYDDRYVLKLAAEVDGVIVSNDNYRDLLSENPEYKKVVEERLLMYSFVNDRFMPPDDPLGRHGPSLDNLLRKQSKVPETLPPPCPYGKKCTYGNKCKYYHPERGNLPQKSVTERLVEQAKIQLQEVKSRGFQNIDSLSGDKVHTPLHVTASCDLSGQHKVKKLPLARTKSLVTSFAGEPFDRTKKDDKGSELLPIGPKLAEEVLSGSPTSPVVSITVSTTENTWVSSSHPTSWASMSLTLPQNIPSPRAELFLEPDSGGHLYVAKRLSDPESLALAKPGKFLHHHSSSKDISQSMDEGSANLHRKLQRQLTLNPAYDPRLLHMHGYASERTAKDQYDRLLLAQRAGSQDNLQSPTVHLGNQHQPVARLGSDSRVVQQHKPWDAHSIDGHQNVTRIASAPDSTHQWYPDSVAAMQRLSSTSDTRLNVGLHHASYMTPYQEHGASNWLLQSGGRQMMMPSAAMMPTRSSLWQEGGHSVGMVVNRPVRPSSMPPQRMMSPLATPRAMSPDIKQDNHRSKLYYHLSSIFPEEQVKATMEMYPEETNPQQICAAILAMYPKK